MSLSNVYSTYEINKLAAALAGKFPGGGSVTEVTGISPINVDDNTTTPEISLKLGLFLEVDGSGDLDLKVSNAPVAGKILSAVDTSGEMQWTNAGTGTLTEITSGDGVIGIADPNGPVPSLTVNVGTFLQKTGGNLDLNVAKPTVPDQVLSSDTTGALSWVAQTGGGGGGTVTLVKSPNAFINIANPSSIPNITINTGTYVKNTTANLLDLNVGVPLNDNDILSSTKAGALTWVTPAAGTIYTGTPPIAVVGSAISLPINGIWSPTNNVVKSTNEDTLQWGSDTTGTGTVTNVTAAFPLTVATGTSSSTPAISLNLSNSFESDSSNKLALKTTAAPVDGYILSAVGTEGILNWIAPPAAGTGTVTSVTETPNQYCKIGGTPTEEPTVGLNIVGAAGTNGQILSATATVGELAFVNLPAAGITSIANGVNTLVDSTNPNVPIVNVKVSGVYAAGNVVGSSDAGTTMEWIAPPSSGVTSVAAGAGILVDIETPYSSTNPLITTSLTPDSFLTKTAGTTGFQLDLNVGACPSAGYVLSSTAGGGSSEIPPVLSWVAQTVIPDPLTFTAPLNLTGSTVTLPIGGTWVADSNDVVKGSSATTLTWGSGATAGITSIANGVNTLVDSTNPNVPIVNVKVSGVYAAGDVVGSSDTGTTMQWVAQRNSVTSITAGNGIVVDTTTSPNTPAVPLIHTAIVSNSFLTNTVGGTSMQMDLNVGPCPTAGYVLSCPTTNGGGGSGVAPALAWIAPAAASVATIERIIAPATPTFSIIVAPSGAITQNIFEGFAIITLGNMSTFNAFTGLTLLCTVDCPTGVGISILTTDMKLVPPVSTVSTIPSPYFNSILYNVTTGYNIMGKWSFDQTGGASWNTYSITSPLSANLNPPLNGDVLYLDLLPFTYINNN